MNDFQQLLAKIYDDKAVTAVIEVHGKMPTRTEKQCSNAEKIVWDSLRETYKDNDSNTLFQTEVEAYSKKIKQLIGETLIKSLDPKASSNEIGEHIKKVINNTVEFNSVERRLEGREKQSLKPELLAKISDKLTAHFNELYPLAKNIDASLEEHNKSNGHPTSFTKMEVTNGAKVNGHHLEAAH